MLEIDATLDQCMLLPGEIEQFVLYNIQQECHAHGCVALNQMIKFVLAIKIHILAIPVFCPF